MKEQKFNEKQINHVLTRDPLEQAEKTFGKRKEAVKEGADYLVIGRAVTSAPDRLKAIQNSTIGMSKSDFDSAKYSIINDLTKLQFDFNSYMFDFIYKIINSYK